MSSALKPALTWNRVKFLPIALGFMSLSLTSPALAQEKVLRTLTVTGRGIEEISTTITQVRLGVEAQGKTANEVQESVARRSNAVVTLLKSRNVEKLETTGINLNPIYSYDNNRQKLDGYSASNLVSFRVPTEKAGTLLDDAVKAGASRIDGVSFVATDDAIATAQKLALRKATQDAQGQADAVFSALNLTRREVVSIQVNGAAAPPPMLADVASFRVAAAQKAPTPVIGGEQRIEGSVTLQISY
ncbi:SIMPL domain-containing protein [Phormidesmis priestleyi]|uniref:SIMPL domain-containing protein n=1 Tax=Phormidesmis priestleyi TaxID=268141 RepID=UPI00083B1850|nr:SIMPL domain-containing protein [Phormidesmis priestleyi]